MSAVPLDPPTSMHDYSRTDATPADDPFHSLFSSGPASSSSIRVDSGVVRYNSADAIDAAQDDEVGREDDQGSQELDEDGLDREAFEMSSANMSVDEMHTTAELNDIRNALFLRESSSDSGGAVEGVEGATSSSSSTFEALLHTVHGGVEPGWADAGSERRSRRHHGRASVSDHTTHTTHTHSPSLIRTLTGTNLLVRIHIYV